MQPYLLPAPIKKLGEMQGLIDKALKYAVESGLCMAGKEVIVLTSTSVATRAGDTVQALLEREVMVTLAPGRLDHEALGVLAPSSSNTQDPKFTAKTISLRWNGAL
jgi:pyruvate kinase